MLRLVMTSAVVVAAIQIAACGADSSSSQLEDLTRQVEDLNLRTEALERALVERPDTGDDWQAVRDAATPQLRRSVDLYAACRAGEWSHPFGGGSVIQNEVLDEAGLAVAAGLEEALWRDIATGRIPNSQSAVVRMIDRTHDWPHCAMEGLYDK